MKPCVRHRMECQGGHLWEGTRDGFFRVEKAKLCMRAGRRCCRWWVVSANAERVKETRQGTMAENYLHMAVGHSVPGDPDTGSLSVSGSDAFLCIRTFLPESGSLPKNVLESFLVLYQVRHIQLCSQDLPLLLTAGAAWVPSPFEHHSAPCTAENLTKPSLHPLSLFPGMNQTQEKYQRGVLICKYTLGNDSSHCHVRVSDYFFYSSYQGDIYYFRMYFFLHS